MQILNQTLSCDAHISITELHVAFGHTKKEIFPRLEQN